MDNKCFLWSVLACLLDKNDFKYPHLKNANPKKYFAHTREVNMTGITYPVGISQLRKFEELNPTISLNVLG